MMIISLSSTLKALLKVSVFALVKTRAIAGDDGIDDAPTIAVLDGINVQLAENGLQFQVESVGMFAIEDAFEMGREVFASDRGNKQLSAHWVPYDTRREWSDNGEINFIIDSSEGATASGLSSAQTGEAIKRAMSTWDEQACSDIPITNPGSTDVDIGVIQAILGFGGSYQYGYADIAHAGFLPSSFFDELAPSGGDFILGATFTFRWIDGDGEPTDIDNNGKNDAAFREIYYNDGFPWGINDENLIDVETVVLHEAGHALSQAHFGEIFRTVRNGKVKFAPRAVMNAAYSGIQQDITKTDKAGHCSIWASWPNN